MSATREGKFQRAHFQCQCSLCTDLTTVCAVRSVAHPVCQPQSLGNIAPMSTVRKDEKQISDLSLHLGNILDLQLESDVTLRQYHTKAKYNQATAFLLL